MTSREVSAGSLGIGVDGYLYFEEEGFHDLNGVRLTRISLGWCRPQIRQAVFKCSFEVKCDRFQQHRFGLFG